MGIGKGIDVDTLELIAGDKTRVVMVDDFDELKDKIKEIKSKVCSGKLTSSGTRPFYFPATKHMIRLSRLLSTVTLKRFFYLFYSLKMPGIQNLNHHFLEKWRKLYSWNCGYRF